MCNVYSGACLVCVLSRLYLVLWTYIVILYCILIIIVYSIYMYVCTVVYLLLFGVFVVI